MTTTEPFDFDAVFREELEELRKRKEQLINLPVQPFAVAQPSIKNGLVGLALSGGGIRSATFCLGVLQSFVRENVFPRFDYLSTVSGGGFVGAAVSAALNRKGDAGFPFPPSREGDTPELTHFRSNANYLNPGGLLSAARFPALLLRGVLLNVLALTPWLMLAVFLTGVGYVYSYNEGHLWWLSYAPLALGVPFVLLLITYPLTAPLARWGLGFRERYDRIFSGALLLLVIGVLLTGLFDAAVWAIETPTEDVNSKLVAVSQGLHLPLIVSLLCAAFVGARFLAPKTMHSLTRVAFYMAGALVPLVGVALYLYECMTQIESSRLPTHLVQFAELPAVGAAAIHVPGRLCKALADRGVNWEQPAESEEKCSRDSKLAAVPCTHEDHRSCFEVIVPRHSKEERYPLWWDTDTLRFEKLSYERVIDYRKHGDRVLIGVCVFVFLLYFFVLDANAMSLHGFYRDSLSRLFLLSRGSGDPKADLRLSTLDSGGTGAPYPIINATINVQGVHEASLRDRSGAAFALSPLFSGGPVTGYARTKAIEAADSDFCLASAVAISAAAAGPHMGSFTVRSLTLLLTLFNIRLGYWLPNPRHVIRGRFSKKPPGPRYIWHEALGAVNASRRFVNVSDGGHFENLGVYELLRRKCKLIVAIDGEEDAGHRFKGFVRLLHLARVDFGIAIEAKLADIRHAADGLSKRHFLWANIRYGADECGQLLYIKASFTGDESPGLQAYRAQFPKFPHESTADQFFSEVQFEAYRLLGEHIGDQTLKESGLLGELGLEATPQSLRPRHPDASPVEAPGAM